MALRHHGVVRVSPAPETPVWGARSRGGGSWPRSSPPQRRPLGPRYLQQISELTFPEDGQQEKFRRLTAHDLEAEMKTLR